MTKLFLTAVLSLFTIISSAQMMVTSSLSSPEEGADWAIEDLTDNLGLGYTMDKFTVGVMMNGDNYDLFGRYSLNDNLYVSGLMTEEEEISLGVGYALNVWNNLYIEPSYLLATSFLCHSNNVSGEKTPLISNRAFLPIRLASIASLLL